MDDVARLFRKLVEVLAADDPGRVRRPFTVEDLHEHLLPYRRYRGELGFDSIEDYEVALLRLLAGDGGYVTLEPARAREALALEAQAINPETGAYRAFGDATVRLDLQAVQAVMNEETAYQPPAFPLPQPRTPAEAEEARGEGLVFEAVAGAEEAGEAVSTRRGHAARCPACDGELPTGRTVAFCPFCGERLAGAPCPACGERVEGGWRYCPACGHEVRG